MSGFTRSRATTEVALRRCSCWPPSSAASIPFVLCSYPWVVSGYPSSSQILTVVALLSSKPFFLNPMERREEAKKYVEYSHASSSALTSARRARSMFYTSRSDLLSDVKAFEACLAARSRSNGDLRIFAEDVSSSFPSRLLLTDASPQNFISLSTFRDVLNLRNEYLTALSDVGFVPFRASSSAPAFNENAENENLLKAIIFAGTGRLVKVKLPPAVFDKGISGTIERDRLSKEVKFYEKDGGWVPLR